MVYVLDIDGTPLMPTERYGKVRKMLNRKQAKIVNRRPFTIQLLYKSTGYVQPVTLGVDASNSMIGLSVSTSKKEIYASEIELRKDVSLLVKQKTRLKNLRRKRKHRTPRPNRKKGLVKKNSLYYVVEGIYSYHSTTRKRLKVSSEQKIQSHISAVNRVTKMIPVNNIIVETNQFNRDMVDNPRSKSDRFYKCNQREYVINRDHHTCQWCKGKNKDPILVTRPILEIPFVYPQYYHSTSNTITLCKTCSNHIDKLKEKEIELGSRKLKKKERNYYSIMAALDNIASHRHGLVLNGKMRAKVYKKLRELYPNVHRTTGYVTKQKRIEQGLKNTPINNARIITGNHPEFLRKYYYVKLRRCHNRQLQRATPSKKTGLRSTKSPYFTKGFTSYDLVSFNGKEYYITKKRKTGYFGLGTADGTTLINSVKWDRIKLLQRRKSYSVEARVY